MARVIKFRAWGRFGSDKTDKMISDWSYSELPEYVGFDGGRHFIVEQFTGLLCRGKEVYEGDLLRRSASIGKGTVIGEVYFNQGQFRIRWAPEKNGWNNTLYIHLVDCEIVGNIHENPELLK